MNSLTALLVSIFIFSLGYASPGGDDDWAEKGNGGDLITCKNTQPYFLDYYEAKYIYKLSPQISYSKIYESNNYEGLIRLAQRAQRIFEKLERFDRKRSALYSEMALKIPNYIRFSISPPPNVDDEDLSFRLPTNCRLSQLINQRREKISGEASLQINRMLWSSMSSEQKITALIHEVILQDVRSRNLPIRSTKPLRKLCAYLISSEFQSLQSFQYRKLISDIYDP